MDILAWHPHQRALLIAEVKSRLLDVQDLFAGCDRKARIVPGLVARERGWRAQNVGQVLVAAETTANRRVVEAHHSSFAATFPGRAREARRWLSRPQGALAALASFISGRDGRRAPVGVSRVRLPSGRSS